MSQPSHSFKISDTGLVTIITHDAVNRILIRHDAAQAYVAARQGKSNFVSASYGIPTGFVKLPGTEATVLGFAPDNIQGDMPEMLNAPAAALGMLLVMRFGNDKTEHIFCMHDSANDVAKALVSADPTIETIIISGKCVTRPNGLIHFIQTSKWFHPTIEAWMNRLAANYKRRRRILLAVGINPEEEIVARHVHGCNKFTPDAAERLRKRTGWKGTFEDFVCACGHDGLTDELARPTSPTPAPSPA